MNGQAAVKKAQTCFQFSQEIFIVDLKKSFLQKWGGFSNDFMGISWWYMYITILIYLDMKCGIAPK